MASIAAGGGQLSGYRALSGRLGGGCGGCGGAGGGGRGSVPANGAIDARAPRRHPALASCNHPIQSYKNPLLGYYPHDTPRSQSV